MYRGRLPLALVAYGPVPGLLLRFSNTYWLSL